MSSLIASSIDLMHKEIMLIILVSPSFVMTLFLFLYSAMVRVLLAAGMFRRRLFVKIIGFDSLFSNEDLGSSNFEVVFTV